MELIKCRTCLRLSNKNESVDILSTCYSAQSTKEALIFLVPEMESTLRDDDIVCRQCFKTIKTSVNFIETCITVENILIKNKNAFVTSEGVIALEVDSQEGEELENIIDLINSDHNYVVKDASYSTSSISHDNKEILNINETVETVIDSPEENEPAEDFVIPVKIEFDESLSESNMEGGLRLSNYSSVEDLVTGAVDFKCEETLEDDMEPDLSCIDCDIKFSEGEDYELHMESHILLCSICGQSFPDEETQKQHMTQHQEDSLKVCEFCGKTLKGARSLKMHIAVMHEEPSFYMCDRCPKVFKHKYKVNLHIKEVHERARQQQCSACGKLFVNSETCKNHYRLVHLQLKPFVCMECGVKFGRKDTLQRHMREHDPAQKKIEGKIVPKRIPKHGVCLKHPGKPVTCNVCGKQIQSVHLLKAHLENHVKIRRFKCKYCDLTFTISNNRKRHEKLHERDPESKFRCNICWKKLRTEDELEIHVKTHDRPPQYACETCGERFHRKYLLHNHISEKHTSPEDIERAVEEIVVKNLLEYADPKKIIS